METPETPAEIQFTDFLKVDIRSGTITKTGDALMRHALYEAATSMLVHATKPSALRNWALVVAKRRGLQKARVALARRLAVVLHRMWRDGSVFQPQGRLTTI
jgi:hypothetical protein